MKTPSSRFLKLQPGGNRTSFLDIIFLGSVAFSRKSIFVAILITLFGIIAPAVVVILITFSASFTKHSLYNFPFLLLVSFPCLLLILLY